MNSKTIISSALAGLFVFAASQASAAAEAAPEKCYGIAKAGKNDCQTSKNACSGNVKTDNDPEGWIYLPKGTCERIVGASLTKGMASTGRGALNTVASLNPKQG